MASVPVCVGKGRIAMDYRVISYLRPLRRRWALTQSELAFLIGTTTNITIGRIEARRTYPTLAQAIAFSVLFDTPPHELFPELYANAYERVLAGAGELYEALQGNPSLATSTKLDFLEEVLQRVHPHVRDFPI